MTKQAYIGIKYYEDNRNQPEIAQLSRQLEQAGNVRKRRGTGH